MKQYKPHAGESINGTAARTVALANSTMRTVTAKFNDVTLIVKPGNKIESVLKQYSKKSKHLHEEYLKSSRYKKYQQETREFENAQQRNKLKLERTLTCAPVKMTLRDEEGWKKTVAVNTDGYGGAVISFAERWARLMEGRMASGDTLEACAEKTSSLADNEGITGFMYGCDVSILSQVWIHGEKLRHWHNLKTQIRNEGEQANKSGGVLNPALLCIGS